MVVLLNKLWSIGDLARGSVLFFCIPFLPMTLDAIPQAGMARAQVHIPRLSAPPKIEDFLDMEARGEIERIPGKGEQMLRLKK